MKANCHRLAAALCLALGLAGADALAQSTTTTTTTTSPLPTAGIPRLTNADMGGRQWMGRSVTKQQRQQLRQARPWRQRDLSADMRAARIVQAMDLDEKVQLVSRPSSADRYNRVGLQVRGGMEAYSIPPFEAADGGLGVRTHFGDGYGRSDVVPSTSFPAGLALASTWDIRLAERYGQALGKETYLMGFSSILGPTIDLARTPNSGRMFEGFGEDPLLTGRMGAGQVRGVQKNPVIAGVKHYNANNQEFNRNASASIMDERTLQETYSRPWEILVKEGKPGGIMCAFNAVNDDYACSSHHLLTDILKDRIGYEGYVGSDFNAARSTLDANAGLDYEDPDTIHFGPKLKQAVLDGKVPESRLNDMVFRYLRQLIRSGWYDNPSPLIYNAVAKRPILPDSVFDAHAKVASEVAARGIVLLKNTDNALPLKQGTGSIALIGPDLDINIAGSGSATVYNPARLTTTLDGVRQRAAAAGAKIEWQAGVDTVGPADMLDGLAPVPSSVLASDGEAGLHARYYPSLDFSGTPFMDYVEPQVNRQGALADTFPASFPKIKGLESYASRTYSTRWSGTFTPPTTGEYTLGLHYWGTGRLVLDGKTLIDNFAKQPASNQVKVTLQGGRAYPVQIEYAANAPTQLSNPAGVQVAGGLTKMRFGWIPPEGTMSPQMRKAVESAKRADVAVVVVRDFNTEAADRMNLRLPQDQDRLIREVAKVNPRTVVVLETGGPVLMPWIGQVAGVMQAWYAGQAQGEAIAKVLFGDVNPSGKLPISLPRSAKEQPIQLTEQWPGTPAELYSGTGKIPEVRYDELQFVGYRGYDEFGITPLFPFGYGLSYTQFAYSGLQVVPPVGNDGRMLVRFQLRNTGKVAGLETAQVYAELPKSADAPPRQLVGWTQVQLQPGESRTVVVPVDTKAPGRPLSYWDTRRNDWNMASGQYRIMVGGSSRDTPLSQGFTYRASR